MGVLRGLRARLQSEVLGQEEALSALCDALLAGEMGHASPGRPRSLLLLLGPTGTGKTRSILAASEHLFGTGSVARINAAEFSSDERVPLLLGTPGAAGLLGERVARMRRSGGRILLLDEIEKASPRVADLLLGIEEAEVMMQDGSALDLSGLHVVATSNLGGAGVAGLEGVSRASVRRYVEQEAAAHFRPEVFARFTSVIVFAHLSRDAQVRVCHRMLGRELALQSAALSSAFGHPHRLRADPDVPGLLVSEGWHRSLGARPMRNVVERRVRSALVRARLDGALGPGVGESVLVAAAGGGLRAAVARAPVVLRGGPGEVAA